MNLKKLAAAVLSCTMLLGAAAYSPYNCTLFTDTPLTASATDKTADEAIAWAKSKINQSLDYDGNGKWCVDLILGYYTFLGASWSSGDAKNYATNTLPEGWTRIKGAVPQKGDILVYSGNEKNPAGHVAIYESDYSTYHQRYSDHQYVENITDVSYNGMFNPYWGVIRPNFSSRITGTPMTAGAGKTIPDGDYWICSSLSQNLFLDIPGDGISKTGANIQVWNWEDVPTQYDVFTITYKNDGFYEIKQKDSNLCLDVTDASLSRGTNIQLCTRFNNDAQRFSIGRTENNGYYIQAKCGSWYLDVVDAKAVNEQNVHLWEGNGGKCQHWGFIPYSPNSKPIKNGTYRIAINEKDFYLDASGVGKEGSYKNGTNIQIWDNTSDDYFKVEYEADGYYRIKEAYSGLYLEVNNEPSNFLKNQQNVNLYAKTDSRGQLWMPVSVGDNKYFLVNKLSGYYLDLLNGKCVNGQNVSQVYYLGGDPQKWKFILQTTTTTTTTATTTTATTTTTSTAPKAKKYGDANGDGDVTVADAVAILQYIGNKDKYNLTSEGKANADVDGEAGITGMDALTIQKVDAGLIKLEDLPIKN